MLICEMARSAVPLLRIERAWVEDAPLSTFPKAILVGEGVATGAIATPVPDNVTALTLASVLLVTVMLPVTLPAVVGANFTDPATLCPGAMVSGKVKPVTLKPAPEVAICVTDRFAVPVFERVSGLVDEAPTLMLPKLKLAGDIAA